MKTLFYLFPVLLILMFQCEMKDDDHKEKSPSGNLYEFDDNLTPRWSSFENITAEKGAGGKENYGAKGHPYDHIDAGATVALLDVEGQGIINRMWITLVDRSPEMLRSLKLEMFWDGAKKPAVSVPFGDFFGQGLGLTASFENAFFGSPEGRSFNSFISMPFKTGARISVTNESDKPLEMIFFDVNFQLTEEWNENNLYFHAYWSRDTATTPGVDFVLLPRVAGKGRYLGTNIGVNSNPAYKNNWWGEGEVKIFLNGDQDFATLVGSGTEDYIGTGFGQGAYYHRYQGCLTASQEDFQWTFYRYHVPDPVFFNTDCKVTIQQMGGAMKSEVIRMLEAGINLIPVTVQEGSEFHPVYKPGEIDDLSDPSLPEGWTNYYRSDDVSGVAYFYFDKPESNLPDLADVSLRTWNLKEGMK